MDRRRGLYFGLEPCRRLLAERFLGVIAQHEAMPGECLVVSAHPLANIGEAVIEVGMGRGPQTFVGIRFLVKCAHLAACFPGTPDLRIELLGLPQSTGGSRA